MTKPEVSPVPRRKLLLAGAEPPIQGLISTFLLTMGWTCTVIQNKEEAPAVLQREAFDAVLIDLRRCEAEAEQTILKIKQIRPSLGERMLAISRGVADRKILELIERYDLIHLFEDGLLPQLWASLQALLLSPRSRDLAPHPMPVARMVFDSFGYPLPAGVRSLSSGARQLAYQHNKTFIDLSIEVAEGSRRISLAGQVLDGEGKGKNDRLPVLMVSGSGTLARTATNHFGEFQMEMQCDLPEDVNLEIRLGERSWILVPLGKMDWATKQTCNGANRN